jgi:tetratricopeptide (TPR) repeat protein
MGTTTKWSMWTILVPSFFLLVVINAYDVWVGLAALFAAVIVYHVIQWFYSDAAARTVKNLFQNIYLFFVLGLLSLVFVFFGVSIHDALPDKLRVDSLEVRPSWTGTLEIASQTLEGKNALFGSGPNTFVRQWGLYKPAGVNETAFWNADFAQGIGFIPTTIVITGIIGALAWILFLLGFVYENGRVLLKSSPDIRQFVMPLVAGVVYLWTLAIVYPPGIVIITLAFLFTGALVGWGIHAGVVTSYTRAVSDAPRIGPAWSVLLVLIVLISLVVSVFVLRTVVSDMLVNRGISIHNTRQDINAARASIERALVIDSGNDRAYRAALELGIIQISALAASANSADSEALIELQTTISNTIQHGLTAVSQDKNNYQNWISLARIYEQLVGAQVEGAYKNAEQAYQQAIAENPTNPLFYFRLAQLAVVQNDIAKAEGYLQQTLSLKPNYAEALFVLSQVQVAQGDMDTAILTARNTVQAASREPVAWFQLGTLLHQVEKYNEAAEALEQAVFLNSNYANALYMLGLTYAQLDRTVEAKNTLERVRTLNPNNTQVEQALANLAEAREASSDSTENTEQ